MANFYQGGKCGWLKPMLVLLALVFAFSVLSFGEENSAAPAPSTEKKWVEGQWALGDWGGARTKLAEEKGISFDVFLQTDFQGAIAGGENGGFGVWTRVRPTMDIDMNKLVHIKGMSLHITSTWNNGTDVARYLGAIGNATGNDTGLHQFRLDSFWVKQQLFNGKLDLYAGQISGFDFFGFVPQDFSHFMMLGPFYAPFALYNNYSSWDPVTTPAAMLQVNPNKHFYYRTMVQSITECRNPGAPYCGFYNLTNNESGTSMEMKDGVLWNNEVAALYNFPGRDKAKTYPGEVHFGVGYTGASKLIFPVQNPLVRQSDGQTGYYTIVKQAVYRPQAGSNRGLDLGVEYVWGPEEKGVLDFNKQFIATAVWNGPFATRPKDSLNFAFMYTGIRPWIQDITGQTSEKAYEFTYSFQATPFFQMMPVVQIYQNLGAYEANRNGVVMGVRTMIHF